MYQASHKVWKQQRRTPKQRATLCVHGPASTSDLLLWALLGSLNQRTEIGEQPMTCSTGNERANSVQGQRSELTAVGKLRELSELLRNLQDFDGEP